MADLWLFFTLLASVLIAISFSINGRFKADPVLLVFWRSLFPAVLLLPTFMFFEWPSQYQFYVSAVVVGFIGFGADALVYRSAKNYGGSGTTRLLNMRIPIGVAIGFILFPESWYSLVNKDWYIALGVIVAVAICFFSLLRMNRNAVSQQIVKTMIPPVILYGLCDAFQKLGVLEVNSYIDIVMYVCLLSVSMSFFSGAFVLILGRRRFLEPHILKYGAYLSVAWILLVLVKSMALVGMPNSGYYGVFTGLSALWVTLHHKLFKISDDTNPFAGLSLMVGVMLLALLVI